MKETEYVVVPESETETLVIPEEAEYEAVVVMPDVDEPEVIVQDHIIESTVVPEVPQVLSNEQIYVYVPIGSNTTKGIVKFNGDMFVVIDGEVFAKIATTTTRGIAKFNSLNFEVTDGDVTIKKATNERFGTIKGTYASGSSDNFMVDISDGEIVDIYVKTVQQLSSESHLRLNQYLNLIETKLSHVLTSSVTTVNGETGDVVITPAKIGTLTEEQINTIKVNLQEQITTNKNNIETLDGRISDIEDVIPTFITKSVDNLVNYYTKSETYTQAEVNQLVSTIPKLHFEVVQQLPAVGDENIIYLVPSSKAEEGNSYEEYIYINNKFELIGTTKIDLTGYATETWVNNQIKDFLTETQVNALITTALSNYYTKPETGIPKTDLSSDVQTSLSKADTALQNETDPTVPSWAKQPTKPVYTSSEVGALPNTTKYGAYIDLVWDNPTEYKLKAQLKNQDGTVMSTSSVIDLPLESVVVSGSYDKVNKKIILTLENGSIVDIPVGDLVAGLQSEITMSNKLNSDLVDDTNQIHKFVSSDEKSTWNGYESSISALQSGKENSIIYMTVSGTSGSFTDEQYVLLVSNIQNCIKDTDGYIYRLVNAGSAGRSYVATSYFKPVVRVFDISTLSPSHTWTIKEISMVSTNTNQDISGAKNFTTTPTINNNNIATTNQIPTTASEVNALPYTTKYGASINLSMNSSTYVVTVQLKDQDGNNLGDAKTIDLPLESVVVSGSYDSINKKVILTLKDGSTIDFSVADLVSGLQPSLSDTQLSATNSGITSTKVQTYDAVAQQYVKNASVNSTGDSLTITKQDNTTVEFHGGGMTLWRYED